MAKQIFINDSVGTVEFPDTMSEQEIIKAIRFDILKESPEAGDTTQSASPVTVSAPTEAVKSDISASPIRFEGNVSSTKDIVEAQKAETKASREKLFKATEKTLAQEEMRKMEVDPKISLALTEVRKAVDEHKANPTEESYKKAFGLYSANKDIVDYYDSTVKLAGGKPMLEFTQAPEDGKADLRKEFDKIIAERDNALAKKTAESQIVLQDILKSGRSVSESKKELGYDDSYARQGTKLITSGAAGTTGKTIGFFGEVLKNTQVRGSAKEDWGEGFRKVGKKMDSFAQSITPEEMNFLEQVIHGLGSTIPLIVPGLGTEAILLRSPQLAKLAFSLRIGVPSILEAGAEAKGTYDESITKGKFEDEARKAMWLSFTGNLALLAPTNAYGILAKPVKGKSFASRLGATGFGEGLQEGSQTGVNALAQGEQPSLKEFLNDFAVGGSVGLIFGAGKASAEISEEKREEQYKEYEDRIKQVLDLNKLTEGLPAISTVLPLSEQETSAGINQPAPSTGFNILSGVPKEETVVPETKTEIKQTPEQNREEAIQLLEHTLSKEDAIKVVVNLNNQQIESFLNAKEEGYQAVNERVQKLKSVEDRKTKMFAKEEEYRSMADEFGIKYNGLQFYGKDNKSVPLFTDSQTGSTFMLKEGEVLSDAILRVRKRFEENPPAPIAPVEAVAPASIVPEVLPVIEEQKPIEQPKAEKSKVEKPKPVKAEPKPINLDKKKGKRGGRPMKYAQIDENTSPIIASGFRIQPSFELRDNKVRITEEFRGLEDFLDYSNKPSREQLASMSKKRVEGNIDVIADEYFSERKEQGDAETFRESLRKEIDTFAKQGGHWSKEDIDEAVNRLNGFMDNGDQQRYESELAGMSPVVRKKVVDKLQEQWKEQRNESEIAKSDAEIEDFGNQINGATEAEEIDRILQEFDNARDENLGGLSDEEQANIEGRNAEQIEEFEPVLKDSESSAESLRDKEESGGSVEKINDIKNEAGEKLVDAEKEKESLKQPFREFVVDKSLDVQHPYLDALHDFIYVENNAVEKKLSRKQINDLIDKALTKGVKDYMASMQGQSPGQRTLRVEITEALTGLSNVTKDETGYERVRELIHNYFAGIVPKKEVIDRIEKDKEAQEKHKAGLGKYEIILDDVIDKLKKLGGDQKSDNFVIKDKNIVLKYHSASGKVEAHISQNHLTEVVRGETETEHDIATFYRAVRNEIDKEYNNPKSSQEVKKNLDDIDAGLIEALGDIPLDLSAEEQAAKDIEDEKKKKKPGELDDDVLLQEGTTAFDKWFGDSKVVDEEGDPLVVYHGTNKSFNEFDENRWGMHFGTLVQATNVMKSKGKPEWMGGEGNVGQNLMPIYLSIQNPLRVADNFGWGNDSHAPLIRDVNKRIKKYNLELPEGASWDTIKRIVNEAGYDGFVYENTVEGGGDAYVPFNKGQIKSAIGNKGTYDASNPNILLQEGEVVKPSYDNEIRYQKVKFYFNQMFRELGKDQQKFKERISSKYGNKLDNFVKRFFDENEIQERPTVQYVNAGKLPIPPQYVTAPQYNNEIDDHQLYAVNLMIHNFKQGNKAFLLADGTGFGKTRIELAFADYMFKATGRPALLVTQNKAIIENSIKREAGAIGVGQVEHQSELFDKKGKRIVSMNKDHIEVVTYDDIKSKHYKVDQQYSVVIFDEAQNLKNTNSKRAMMSDNIKADHHVYATATPMDNPHNAEYFLSKITGIPEHEIRHSMGYKVIFGEDQWHNPTRKIEYEEGKSYSSVQRSLLKMRDSAIENGAMVRREYPFYGMVQPMYMALDQFQLAEQEQIDTGYGNHPKARMAAIGELSRWVEPLKVNRVFDSAMQDLKEGKQVIIVAENISDTELKKLGTTVQGFITAIGNKFTDAGIPYAKIYGGGSLIGDIDKFQSGELRLAIMTPKSGGAGVNLDDAQGKSPRKMYVVTTNYAGDVFEQVLGRVSRRNTKSPADIRLVQFTNATTDRNRQNIIQRKLSTLHSIQSGIDPDKAQMDENEIAINGVIRTSGENVLRQEGEEEITPKISTKKIKNIFDKFLKDDSFGTKEYGLHGLLADWNGAEIDKDDGKLYFNDTRSSTGYWNYSKTDFIKWLMSDEAKDMSDDTEYQSALSYARNIISEEISDKQLFQTGEPRTPISIDEVSNLNEKKSIHQQVIDAIHAQLPEIQWKGAEFIAEVGARTAVSNGTAKSIDDWFENRISKVVRMNYDPNMVFGDALNQVFDKGLFAVHNTDAEMIPTFLNEGGIPAPSIAVLASPENFTEFSSEVQLIFERKTVDPQADSNNRLFSNDVYSPRASEYRGSLQKVVEQVKKEFEKRPRGAEFGEDARTAIPLRVFVAQEFKDLQQAKDASGNLIKTETNEGLSRLARQSKTELRFAEAVNDILFKEPIGEIAKQDKEAKEYSIRLVENQSFGIDQIRQTLGITKTDKATNDKLYKIQLSMFELFHNVAPSFFEAKPLRVVGVEEIQGVIVSPRMFQEVKKMTKGTILEGKVYVGGNTHDRLAAIRDLLKRNPQIMFQEDLSKELEEQYIREQEAKGNLNIREQIKDQKYQKELGIRKAELAQKRQAKENQFNSLVRQESQFKREIELARKKNDQEGVKKGLSALKSVQQQMNRLYKELGKSTDDMFDESPTLFQIPGEKRKTVQGASDFTDFARTGKVGLYIFENANFSTIAHEFLHIWRRTGVFNEEQIDTLNKWVGSNDWSNWTKSQEEKLARGWERYLYNGEAPNQALRRIFQKMKKWMQEIYVFIQKGDPLDINLPIEVKRVFDALFDENAKTTEIFARVREHDDAKRQARQRMNAQQAQQEILYRMYATPEMKPLLDKRAEIVKKMKTADPFQMNDLEEELVPLNAQIDEMSTQLKQLKSLAKEHHQLDGHGNFFEQFISRFALMTRKLGKAGGELVQMGFAADLVRSKLNDVARPHLHEIAKVYSKYSEKNLKVSFKQRDISRAVIQAIEEKRNSGWLPGQDVPKEIVVKNEDGTVNEEMTVDAKIVFQETKQLLDKFRDILTSLGYKTRDAYFAHIMSMDILDQQLMIEMQNRTQTDEQGNTVEVKMEKDINAESNRLKPRQDVQFDYDMNLPRVLSSYVGSVTRKLSYDKFVDYIKKELVKDISPFIKSGKNTETILDIARDYARNVMHPAAGSGKTYRALEYLRKNQYQAFLAYNVKASIDNRLQVNLARLYVGDEADKLESKLWNSREYEGVYGNLHLAIERSRNAMQNYMELILSADDNMGKFRQFFERNDIFKSAEATNWRRAEMLGIVDSAMKDKRYTSLLAKHNGNEIIAINGILDDDVAFDKAVSNASYVSVESQVGITPSVRPVIYDHPLLRVTVLMLRSFKNRQVELMVRSLKTIFNKDEGMRENALRSIFARGITPDAESAEALQYFADYKKSLEGLIKQMKKEGLSSRDGLTLHFMESYYDHIVKQEKELAEIVKQIEPGTMTRRRIGKIWAKYYGLLTVNSFSSKLFWYFVSPFLFGLLLPDDKDKEKKSIEDAFDEAYMKVLLDLSPIPAYGGNPKNLTVTPILPNFGALENLAKFGTFSGRELSKDLVNYSMNSLVPYLGVANRALDYRLSSGLVDVVAPKKTGKDLTPQEKMEEKINRQRKALEKRTGQ